MMAAVDLSEYDRVASWNHGGFCYVLCAKKIDIPPVASSLPLGCGGGPLIPTAERESPSRFSDQTEPESTQPTTGNIITDLLDQNIGGEDWLGESPKNIITDLLDQHNPGTSACSSLGRSVEELSLIHI